MTNEELQGLLPTTQGELEALQEAIRYRWEIQRRPEQWPPVDDNWWLTWMFLAGRGSGKTRSGAELIRHWAETGRYKRFHIIGPTSRDVKRVMVEGDSGILSVCPPDFRPRYEPSNMRLVWPNGAIAELFSADEPERLRGPQCEAMWCDEVASWRRPAVWDMAQFGLRLGKLPRAIVTGTPKPTKLIKSILNDPTTYVSRGSTFDNIMNLAPQFIQRMKDRYEGTRLGRQELYAEVLEDNADALWSRDMVERNRVVSISKDVMRSRVAVALDPSIQDKETSDEAGIVGGFKGSDGLYYITDDVSLRAAPHKWASEAIALYHKTNSDRIVYENNQGGLMVEDTLNNVQAGLPLKAVVASRGKALRAEPISALYEKDLVKHLGTFQELEDEMCQWEPGMPSPNRLDALVYVLTFLHGGAGTIGIRTGLDVRPRRGR